MRDCNTRADHTKVFLLQDVTLSELAFRSQHTIMIPTISQEIEMGDTTLSNSRLKAAQWFQTAVARGLIDVSQPGIEEIFLADLYRRAGDFQAASQILEQSQMKILETSLLQVLEYEKRLIQAEDTAYYHIANV